MKKNGIKTFEISKENSTISISSYGFYRSPINLPSEIFRDFYNQHFTENFDLLRYYAASCGNCLPTFRDNVPVPSSQVKSPSREERKKASNL
jgi:hypothetical protein